MSCLADLDRAVGVGIIVSVQRECANNPKNDFFFTPSMLLPRHWRHTAWIHIWTVFCPIVKGLIKPFKSAKLVPFCP